MSAHPHEAPLQFVDPRQFKANTQVAVDDAHLRSSFRSAMDFVQSKRAAHFGDHGTSLGVGCLYPPWCSVAPNPEPASGRSPRSH